MSDTFLRPWALSDVAAVLAAFTTPDMASQNGPVDSVEGALEWLAARATGADESSRHFAVEHGGHAVGNVSFTQMHNPHNRAWVSYWISRDARGMGLATRALATACAAVFKDRQIFRLELGHRCNNPASGRVAVNAGFVFEGTERAKLRYGTQRFDVNT